jgi:CubicO group peptidase (beta-lactamase class C family)
MLRDVARWSLAVVLLSGAVLADTLPDGDDPVLAKVDALFANFRPDLPGGAVGLVREGRLIYAKGFGTANLDYGTPNSPQTSFEIASASKAFTSACIALLMDEGKLDPDDDVRRWIPELQLEHPVRIRHMLRCETGMWEQFHIMPLAGWDNVPNHQGYTKADLFTVLTGQKRLPFESGSEFWYGSGEFFLLGIVVERITGQTLAQFAREQFFQPLGMTRTYYEEDFGVSVKDRAVGHWKADEGWSPLKPAGEQPWRLWQLHGYAAGPGGVRTCVEDLHRWDTAFDNDVLPRGKYLGEFLRDGCVLGNRFVVDADAYRKRTQPHPDNEPIGQYRGLARMQFTGGFWGMSTCIARYPEQKFTVICLSNSSELSPFAKTREIAELFLGDRMALLPVVPADEPPVTLTADQLRPLAGAFRDRFNSPVWRTEVRDGKLVLIDQLEKAFTLQPLSATRFRPQSPSPFYPSARFEFVVDDTGIARQLRLSSCEHGFHEVIEFRRVELAPLPVAALSEFAGTYVSEELAATYRFKVEDEALWLRVNSRRWERLRPLTRDEFTPAHRDPHDQRFLRFTRTEAGTIDGFSIGLWRIRGVTFAKQPEP